METFYKILFEKSKFKDGAFHGNIDDIYKGFKEAGFHCYNFAAEHVFTKNPLTPEEYNAIKAENDAAMELMVNGITEYINRQILEDMYKRGYIK